LRKLYPNKRDHAIFAKASDPKFVGEAVEEIRELQEIGVRKAIGRSAARSCRNF
jgi:hypothetical protein